MEETLLIHPGEILREEFLNPHELTASDLAARLGILPNELTAIVNGTRGISGPMSKLMGHASAFPANSSPTCKPATIWIVRHWMPNATRSRPGGFVRQAISRNLT